MILDTSNWTFSVSFFQLVDKCLCNMFLIPFLKLYYRQMNVLHWASKRELNPSWIFLPPFFAKGDVYLCAVLLFWEITGCFVACSLGAAQIQEGYLPLCKSSLSQNKDSGGGLARPPSGKHKGTDLVWAEDCFLYLRFFPRLSWMSLKWTQAVPLCQKHCVIFYVVVKL